jgi:hypothetical protein
MRNALPGMSESFSKNDDGGTQSRRLAPPLLIPRSRRAARDLEGCDQLRSRHRARRPLPGDRARGRAPFPAPARQGRQPHRLHYLAPIGRPASKPYALLRDALVQTGRAGIGTVVLRQRERLAALLPIGKALALVTLRFADEIRSPQALDVPAAGRWHPREMTLTRRLIDALATDWDPTRYRDTYRDALLKVIEQKVKGEEVALPARAKPARVVSLVKALEQSLAERRRAPARAAGRRAGAGPARRATRRAA